MSRAGQRRLIGGATTSPLIARAMARLARGLPPLPSTPCEEERQRERRRFTDERKAEVGERIETPAAARERLFDYTEVFYNQQRRHSALGYESPATFERAAAAGEWAA